MKLSAEQARGRFIAARVARLATADADGRPHLVPVTFAVDQNVLVFAVDHKPKSTTQLRRLHNIAANPQVSVLVDEYAEDWTRLWWARADGTAVIVPPDSPDAVEAVRWLAAKYPQYAELPPAGGVVLVDVARWSGWSWSPP